VVRAAVEPERRRRWPWIVVATFVTVLAAGGVYLARYDPIVAGASGWNSDPRPTRTFDLSALTSSIERVDCYDASRPIEIRYRFSFANEGPIPVTILGAGRSGGFPEQPMRVIPDMYATSRARWEPFHPFELKPGHEASIEMRLMVEDPLDRSGSVRLEEGFVRFRVMGLKKTSAFVAPYGILLAGDPAEFCTTSSAF
jgi:hypothetical protein